MQNELIEKEFERLQTHYEKYHKKNSTSGCKKVVQMMLDRPLKIWWWSYEFVGQTNSKGNFLSHRAPARASDLAIYYPELVEDRRIGKLAVYRLKKENLEKINSFLDEKEK